MVILAGVLMILLATGLVFFGSGAFILSSFGVSLFMFLAFFGLIFILYGMKAPQRKK